VVDPTRRQSPRRACTVAEIAVGDKYAVVGGPFGSKLVTKDYTETGVPVLRGSNLPFDRKIDLSDVVFVSEAKVKEDLFGNLAFPGDIVVTQRGTLGQVGFLPLEGPYDCYVISQSQMKLSVDRTKADPRFIYWYFRLPAVRKTFENLGSSSGVPHINLETFRSFELLLPNLVEQGLIATVLDSFDDLIENNRRRIELLEETARLLYREWLINFRYPGHEAVPLVDSELGPTPQDWEHIPLAEILDTLESGSRPRGGVGDLTAGIPSVGAENINGLGIYNFSKEKFISDDFFSSMKQGVAEPYDVLLYKDGAHIGRTAMFGETFPHRRLAINEHVFRLRSKDPVGQCFLYLWLSEQPTLHRVQMLNSNAAQPGISQQKLLTLVMAVPTPEVLGAFEDRVRPIVEAIFCLANQDKVLVEARNLLLPRLVSGDLDISDLDLSLEAVG